MRRRLPDHVVVRPFRDETVVLDTRTGRCFGLNATAARMLDELVRRGDLEDVAAALAGALGAPPAVVRADLERLCGELEARGLVERDAG